MRSWAALRVSSEIGALPALSSAVFWPSSETTYSAKALTWSAVFWSWYSLQ